MRTRRRLPAHLHVSRVVRTRRRAAVGVGTLAIGAVLIWNAEAQARCVIEEPALALSYPDANTRAVPPDATFWLVPKLGSVRVELDGVELEPLGSSPADQFQF